MKYLFVILIAICFSCNNTGPAKQPPTAADTIPEKKPVPEDSITQALRIALVSVETQELQQTSIIKSMSIENISHDMISLKEFYTIKKEELAKDAKLSTNKERTGKALVYLDNMIAKSPVKKDVYKVQFHLNALLANTTKYNEQHTKYLRPDLTEIRIIFP